MHKKYEKRDPKREKRNKILQNNFSQ